MERSLVYGHSQTAKKPFICLSFSPSMPTSKRTAPRSGSLIRLIGSGNRNERLGGPLRNEPGIKKITVPSDNPSEPKRESYRLVMPWGARVVRFISRRHRIGHKVTLREPHLSAREQTLDFERVEIELKRRAQAGEGLSKREQRALRPQMLIYETCRELARAQKEAKPNIFQLVAAFAFFPELGGIRSRRFRDIVNELHYLYRKTPPAARGALPWIGDPTNVVRILSHGKDHMHVPSRVWGILRKANGRIFSTSELLEALHLPNTRKNQNTLNTSMQFLDLLGLARKHPLSHQQAQWSAANTHAIKRQVSNCYLHVLETVASLGAVQMNDLGSRYNNGFKADLLSRAADRLHAIGLIRIETVPLVGKRNTKRFELTPMGAELLRGWTPVAIAQPLDRTQYTILRQKLLDLDLLENEA